MVQILPLIGAAALLAQSALGAAGELRLSNLAISRHHRHRHLWLLCFCR